MLVFTDPMQTDTANKDRLQPVYQRLKLPGMWCPAEVLLIRIRVIMFLQYKERMEKAGLEFVTFYDLSVHMKRHYSAVKAILDSKVLAAKLLESSDNSARARASAFRTNTSHLLLLGCRNGSMVSMPGICAGVF